MKTGTLKWYNVGKAYGFIIPDDPDGEDVFFHKSALVSMDAVRRVAECGRAGTPIKLRYTLNPKTERCQAKTVDVA